MKQKVSKFSRTRRVEQKKLFLLLLGVVVVLFSFKSSFDTFTEIKEKEEQLNSIGSELELRIRALDAVLKDTQTFEPYPSASKKSTTKSNAIGGGDGPQAPFIRLQPSVANAQTKNESLTELISLLDFKIDNLKRTPLGSPVLGEISSPFGYRPANSKKRYHKHLGVDFSVDKYSPVFATADGTVIDAGYKGAYGNTVVIDHGNGLQTLYAHLSKMYPKIGERICRGERLGLVGATGRATGPHLHYEVRLDGEPQDPERYIELALFLNSVMRVEEIGARSSAGRAHDWQS